MLPVQARWSYQAKTDVEISFQKGDLLQINWDVSTDYWLWASVVSRPPPPPPPTAASSSSDASTLSCLDPTATSSYSSSSLVKKGWIPANFITNKITTSYLPQTLVNNMISQPTDHEWVRVIDTVVTPKKEEKNTPPPPITTDFSSLIFPLSRSEFLSNFWKKKALVVLSTPSRLVHLKEDMHQFNEQALIESADCANLWMNNVHGSLENIEAHSLSFVQKAYRAGATLYMKAEPDFEKKYLFAYNIALNQGISRAISTSIHRKFGGEVEIFVCKSLSKTPWHCDNMDNFTVQLKGTKRWSFLPSKIQEPLKCWNPACPSEAIRYRQLTTHLYASPTLNQSHFEPDEQQWDAKAVSVILRPGSLLYLPNGWFHKVESDNAQGGSLSVNFSIMSQTYGSLIGAAIQQILVGEHDFHLPISSNDIDCVRGYLDTLIERLPQVLEKKLRGSFFTVPVLDHLKNSKSADVDDKMFLPHIEKLSLDENMLFERNPLATLVIGSSKDFFIVVINHGAIESDESVSSFQNVINFKMNEILELALWLQTRRTPFSTKYIMSRLEAAMQLSQGGAASTKKNLIQDQFQLILKKLVFFGYLVESFSSFSCSSSDVEQELIFKKPIFYKN